MRQILCLLLVLLIGGKDGAHSLPLEVKPLADQVNGQVREAPDESLDPASFPEGFTPREIGAKLGRHFIPGEHFLHGGKWIHYAEVCTWLGALKYAQIAGDNELTGMLEKRFEPLFNEEKAYLPIKNHVDLNMFGCLPLEFYQVTKSGDALCRYAVGVADRCHTGRKEECRERFLLADTSLDR